jgi:general secretion pathway protein D
MQQAIFKTALFVILAIGQAILVTPVLAQTGGLNFNGADLKSFIQDVAIETRKTVIIDPKVSGKVNVFSSRPLAPDALYEVMLSVLKTNGYAVTPLSSGAIKIIPIKDAMQESDDMSENPAADAKITRIIPIDYLDPETAKKAVEKLISKAGEVTYIMGFRQLIIADFADNIDRIERLLSELDVDRRQTRIMVVKNTSPRELAALLKEISTGDMVGKQGKIAITGTPIAGTNTLILRGTPKALAQYQPLLEAIDRENVNNSDIRVHKLKYASADSLLPMLQTLSKSVGDKAGKGASATDVTISSHPAGNAIVVNADADTQKWVATLIDELDNPQPQVLVEAIIVEVSDNASRELGVQYLLAGNNDASIPFTVTNYGSTAPNILALAGAVIDGSNPSSGDSGTGIDQTLRARALDTLLASRGIVIGAGGTRSDGSVFGVVLNALRRDVNSNILSTPSIMTLDNQQARFIVGQEIPITTGEALGSSNANPFRTIERKNVGVQLDVLPQINEGDEIRLKIRQEVSAVAGPLSPNSTELITTKREMETAVRVANGEVIVLGGLVRQDERVTIDRVPLLGSIPVLGHLFRSTGKAREKTNLMIFLRPTIVRTAQEASQLTARQYNAIRGLDGGGIPDLRVQDIMGDMLPSGKGGPQ